MFEIVKQKDWGCQVAQYDEIWSLLFVLVSVHNKNDAIIRQILIMLGNGQGGSRFNFDVFIVIMVSFSQKNRIEMGKTLLEISDIK
jgi:hypothetical protein